MAPRPQARPSATLHFFTALSFALLGYATSAPGAYFGFLAGGLALGLFTAAFWLLTFVSARRGDASAVRLHWREWALGPALALVVALRVPLYARFLASLPAMTEAAEQAWRASREGETEYSTDRPRRVGLYFGCWLRVDPHSRSVIVEVPDTGFLDAGGFAYVHGDGTPIDTPDDYKRMFGRWHRVTLDF